MLTKLITEWVSDTEGCVQIRFNASEVASVLGYNNFKSREDAIHDCFFANSKILCSNPVKVIASDETVKQVTDMVVETKKDLCIITLKKKVYDEQPVEQEVYSDEIISDDILKIIHVEKVKKYLDTINMDESVKKIVNDIMNNEDSVPFKEKVKKGLSDANVSEIHSQLVESILNKTTEYRPTDDIISKIHEMKLDRDDTRYIDKEIATITESIARNKPVDVRGTKNKFRGIKNESAAVDLLKLNDYETQKYGMINLNGGCSIVGMCDVITDDTVYEIKNRQNRFFSKIYDNEYIQLLIYMHMFDRPKGCLVQYREGKIRKKYIVKSDVDIEYIKTNVNRTYNYLCDQVHIQD
jgi:hypothetical protein